MAKIKFFYICINKNDLNNDINFNDTNLKIEKLSNKDIPVGNEEYTISIFYMEIEKAKTKIELKFKINEKDYKLKIENKEKAKIFLLLKLL